MMTLSFAPNRGPQAQAPAVGVVTSTTIGSGTLTLNREVNGGTTSSKYAKKLEIDFEFDGQKVASTHHFAYFEEYTST